MTTSTRSSRFEALGAYLPPTVLSTADLLARVSGTPDVDLERITGVAERRVYDPSPQAGRTPMAWR